MVARDELVRASGPVGAELVENAGRSAEFIVGRRGRARRSSGTSAPVARPIVVGSRPMSAQCRSRITLLCRNSVALPHTCHSSANCAAMRNVCRSPPPPMRSGNGVWTGLGSHGASVSWKKSPSKRGTRLRSSERIDGAGLLERVQPPTDRGQCQPVGRVFVPLSAGAEPEHEPATGHLVQGRRHVRHHRRVPVGAAEDERAESQSLGVTGERSQGGPALEHGPVDCAARPRRTA